MTAKDPFSMLAEELAGLRKDIDGLRRSSLDSVQVQEIETRILRSLQAIERASAALSGQIKAEVHAELARTAERIEGRVVTAAAHAAERAAADMQRSVEEAASELRSAARGARREVWQGLRNGWATLVAIGAVGTLLGAFGMLWYQGRSDAAAFGAYPDIYCSSAGGQVVTQKDGSSFCAVWIERPKAAE